MKRAVVTLLVVLFAVPLFAQDSKAQCVSLEHVRGAWRMQIKCEQGSGVILLADRDGDLGLAHAQIMPTGPPPPWLRAAAARAGA